MSEAETRLCDHCRYPQPAQNMTEYEGRSLCPFCLDELTVVCESCGERIWRSDDAGDDHTHVCERCYDRFYTTCEDCGRIIHINDAYATDNDDYICDACHENRGAPRNIQSYYYKPVPIFYGSGSRYYGIELEIDNAGEYNKNAGYLLDLANASENHLYIKHDGSLNEGMELVSHPMTLDYHLQEMPWENVLSCARGMGYLSHKTNTCGLHIHVNRNSFGDSEEEQEECIARILFFMEKFWDELLKFSRRNRRQMEKWAARYGIKENPKDVLKHAKSSYGSNRYSCVNLTNEETVEFRIFRGTLRYNTLVATLQLVSKICEMADCLEDEDFQNMSWTSFVSSCRNLPELVQYLKERTLYINEPVATEEEI